MAERRNRRLELGPVREGETGAIYGKSVQHLVPKSFMRAHADDFKKLIFVDGIDNLTAEQLTEFQKLLEYHELVLNEKTASLRLIRKTRRRFMMTVSPQEVVMITAAGEIAPPVYRPSLILDLLVPLDKAQDMHANLDDLYPLWVVRHGVLRANLVLRCQVAILIGGAWGEKVISSAERLLKVLRIVGS
jgi:hypothetical protein